ncbi:MAG: hypothetical protein AAGC95_06490 [Pseudomonadota bacterium]
MSGAVKVAFGLFILAVILKTWIAFDDRLARAKLPPGVYLAAVNPISEKHREIALFRDDGLMLVPPYVEFVCFNVHFIDTGDAIYRKGNEHVLRYGEPGFSEMFEQSKLRGPSGACRGEKDYHTGHSLLIRDSNYRRDWWEWWRPFED